MDSEALIVHRRDGRGAPQFAETHLSALRAAPTTPQDELFLVHHYDPPPGDAVELGKIELQAPDGSPIATLTTDSLQGLPQREVRAVIECAGNGRRFVRHKAPGTQFGRGLCGCAVWSGVPLTDVFAAHGVSTDFATVVVHGADSGWAAPENRFARFGKGLPVEKALHPDTLLAVSLNGERVPHEHGGPIRLVVPGWMGIWWVKWPTSIRCSNEVFAGFWQNERYRYVDGEFEEPVVVTEQLPRALVLEPIDGDFVDGRPLTVSGRAWAGSSEVVSVEVSVDNGRSWVPATLGDRSSRWEWTPWSVNIELHDTPVATISARAVDAGGAVQPWDSRHNRLGYGNNDIQTVTVAVRS
jgi:DMSO/TMAO reductase YedYZ molybdopterin-dependent catalytic subunit